VGPSVSRDAVRQTPFHELDTSITTHLSNSILLLHVLAVNSQLQAVCDILCGSAHLHSANFVTMGSHITTERRHKTQHINP